MSRAAIVATFRAGVLWDERSPLRSLFTSPYTLSLQLSPPLLCCAYLWLLSRLSFCFFVLLRGFLFSSGFNFRSCRFVRPDGLSVCERRRSTWLAGFPFLRIAAVSAQRSAISRVAVRCFCRRGSYGS